MREFKTFHPIVNFVYFVGVIAFSMIFMNPVCLVVSLTSSVICQVMMNGTKAVKFNIVYMLPVLIIAAFMNPAFNHAGVTILTYLPSGNPLTLESIVYGIAAATMLITVIGWFSVVNEIMTSDKIIYLFGKIIPSLSLVISMTLRFVPKFKAHIKETALAQRSIGRDVSSGSILERAKNGIKILSIMITWSLENAIETADSMKCRGYGLPGRSSFSNYRFDRRDAYVLSTICFLSIYIIIAGVNQKLYFSYFPMLKGAYIGIYEISVYAAYFVLCCIPAIIKIREVLRWKKLKILK